MTMPPVDLEFTDEMRAAWDRLGRDNVFVTGRAGTGKSTLLTQFCSTTNKRVVKLAPTGVAALNIGGSTLHSFFGFKPGIQPSKAAAADIKNPELYRSLDALIIDESSMVRADHLDRVDACLRVHGPYPGEHFGGVPVALFGDPYQLPPVVTSDERVLLRPYRGRRHFFAARAYENIPMIQLTQAFRQTDQDFLHVLDGVRNGTATSDDLQIFDSRVQSEVSTDYIRDSGSTVLMARKRSVREFNADILASLPGTEHVFNAVVSGHFPEGYEPTDRELCLKRGAKVMLLTNNLPHWVNGTVGEVTYVVPGFGVVVSLPSGKEEFIESHTWTRYHYTTVEGRIEQVPAGEFTQLPVKLAWAVTVHKAQGLTLDWAVVEKGTRCLTRASFTRP